MSSKKLVCFLVISFVCGLIVSGVAHASIIGIKGVVSDAEGTPLVGVKVIAPDFGDIPVTYVTGPDGAYSLPYISFRSVVIKAGDEITVVTTDTEANVIEKTHTVTAADITAGEATFNITLVSTTVTVAVAPKVFSADTPGTGTVTVTVEQDGPVTDETVTLRLSPQVGSVGAATNNGDGTYTASYTSGGTAGRITVTARATQANASGTATITINAGPPAAIELSAAPETVSSFGSAVITAMVTDSNDNGVGGASLTGTTSGDGTITNFVENPRTFGAYTATYTAPMVDAEGTDMITVRTADISAELTVNLTPVPPREVSILIVEGTVFKEDGEIPADGVKVTVTAGANPPQMGTTDQDGGYSVTLFSPLGIVARTGDPVSIVVTDDTDAKRSETNLILNNDQLGEDGTGTVDDGNVTTDIVIPPRSVSLLVVEGVIYSDDGVSPLEDVDVTVTVAVGSTPPEMTTIDADGNYSVTSFKPLGTVASTGDMVSTVVVTDADGAERGRAALTLTNLQLGESGSATVTLNVMTDITLPPKSVNILVVEGVVYRDDEKTPVGPGLDVAITVGAHPSQMTQTVSDGSFTDEFIDFLAAVASSGDAVSIVVSDGSGERGRAGFTLSNVQLGDANAATVTQNVNTNIGATSGVLAVIGTVFFKNGETQSVPAASHFREGDLTVVVTNTTRNLKESGPVDDDGGYDVNFLNLLGIVAETGDMLTLEVQNEAGDTVGTRNHTLTTSEVTASNASVDIHTTVPAEIRALNVIGSVIQLNGSLAGAGLEVAITIAMNGDTMEAQTVTDIAGGYEHPFVKLLTPVAATGDILIVDVLRASDQFRGHRRIPLRTYELVDGQITVPPIRLVPPRLELGGLSINPAYTGIQDPIIQEFLGMDLAGLAAAGASTVDPSGDLLVSLPPSPFLLLSPILAAIGAYQLELPQGFDIDDPNIAKESFGNAITTRPTAWTTFSADARLPGRWVNGDQLNLYISGAPTIESVTFTLNGTPMSAMSVPAGGSFMYNFQLEEEWIALFSGSMPTFAAVQLMIDGQMPVDMTRDDMGVWSADVALAPGAHVSYYYMIELSKPYIDPMGGIAISKLPLLDPRNRQVRTDGLNQLFEELLTSELAAINEGVRSVFSVPAVDHQQSLWVGTLPLAADGAYQLDVNVSYRGGHQENITGKTFTVDQTPPTADVSLNLNAPGDNAGLYMREDRTYVATGPMPGEASLTVSIPGATSNEPDGAGYMFQLAKLDSASNLGIWNPVVTADLLPLNLEKLLSNPGSVLPLTGGGPIDMLIRNSAGGALYGTYGLRAVGIDSLLNMDSGRGPGVVVDLVPPDPDIAMVSSVAADFDGNGVIEGLEIQSTAGDVVVFSDSIVTLTVDVVERTDHPLMSIVIEVEMPGVGSQPVAMFSGDQLTAIMMGDQLPPVTLPVPDIPGLPDRGSHAILRTITTNALNVVSTQEVSVAYQRRTPPEVSAIHTYVTDRHPDSGAAQGMITVSAFTQAMTAPDAAAVQLEIRRSADADWMPLGIVQIADTTVTSHVEIAIIEDLVNSILSGSPTAPISPLYREWFLAVDSVTLEDTILDDTPAASDASLDDNPYVVRAIAVDMAGGVYPSADGITDSISLDNYSPTAITTVANEVEMVAAREDGSYYVSGLLHESVPDPMLTLTSRTGAHPSAFTGGIALAVNDASGTAMEIPATGFSDSGNYTFTGVFNLSSIPNGTYTFMAAAHAADGSPEDRIVAMAITVEVGNFTPPDNFADPSVDILSVTNTRGEANSPSEIDAMYTTGFPAVGDKVTPTLIVPNVSTGDLDVLIGDDGMSAAMMGALMVMEPDANNNIVIMIDTSGLNEGMYGLVGTVTKPNGSVPFGLPSIRVDRTGPAIEIVSPLSRHQVTTLPTIQVSYTDASGFDPNETNPMPAVISLTRLADSKAIDINTSLIRMTAAADGEILTQSGDIVYTHDDPVVGGAYRIEATVTDVLGNESTAEPVEFTVEGVQPTVTIASPLAGQIIDPRQPLIITAAFTGNGEITVTEFQVNGTDVEGTLEDNWLTHTMQPPLVGEAGSMLQRGSDNTISVKIVDAEGRTAAGSATFAVSLDNTAPIISGPVPKGDVTRKLGRVTAVVTDNESNITRIQFAIDDNPLQDLTFLAGRVVEVGKGTEVQGQTNYNFFDAPIGTHTVTLVAESTGGSATLTWEFTIIAPDTTPPQIVTYSPLGIIRTDRPVLAATVSDESGFARDGITLILAGVPGNQGSGRRSSPTSTTVTFTPSIAVTPGPYTARITVIDRYKNRTEAEWQFTVELDETPPAITTISPQGVVRSDKPIISVSASDDMSGVDTIEIGVKGEGNRTVEGLTSVRSDRTSATFTPTAALTSGVYTVDVKLADMSGNKASGQWQFTVELDTIPPSIVITRPTQEHTENRRPIISATYTDNMSGVDADSVTLSLDGTTVTPDAVSETQVTFTSPFDLTFGQHTVTLAVSDMAPTPNTATQEWSFFVERVGIADARNYPNPFEDGTTITFRLSRQASVSVRIYDFTGRLVAQPITNSLREAGPVEIAWSGDTSAGENLARGVYFCHILMESELEPQSAILKMAIISE